MKELAYRDDNGLLRCSHDRKKIMIESQALRVAKSLRIDAYECFYGGFWHVGHERKSLTKAKRRKLSRRKINY